MNTRLTMLAKAFRQQHPKGNFDALVKFGTRYGYSQTDCFLVGTELRMRDSVLPKSGDTAARPAAESDKIPLLIHTKTGEPVQLGEKVKLDNDTYYVIEMQPPKHVASEGKVLVSTLAPDERLYSWHPGDDHIFYVSVFNMKWINRNDGRND